MKKTAIFFKSLKGKIVLIVCILLAGIIIRQSLENLYEKKQVQTGTVTTYEDGSRVGRNLSYAETVPEDNKILQAFYEQGYEQMKERYGALLEFLGHTKAE